MKEDYQPTYVAPEGEVGLNDSRPRPPCKRCKRWPALNTGNYCRECRPVVQRMVAIKKEQAKVRAIARAAAKKAEAADRLRAEQMSLNIIERSIDL